MCFHKINSLSGGQGGAAGAGQNAAQSASGGGNLIGYTP